MRSTQALPALAGLGSATAVLVEFIAFPDSASSNDPAAAIAEYYSRHGGADLVADYLSFVAAPLVLIFLCGTAWTMSAAALRFLTATAAAAAVFELAATAVEMALAANVATDAPDTTTAAVYQLASRLFFVSLLWLGLAVGTVAVCALAPTWRRWLGGITSVALVLASLAVAHPHGVLGMALLPAELLLVMWVAAGAVADLTGRRAPVDRLEASPARV
jgi:hypothetical protein